MRLMRTLAGAAFALAVTWTAATAQDAPAAPEPAAPAVEAPEPPAVTTTPAAEAPAAVTTTPTAEAPAAPVENTAAPAAEERAEATPSAGTPDASVPPDSAPYIFNTLIFLMGGFLVMFMAAGFAMLEAGLVRSKNAAMQCLKNIALYSIAGVMFWVLGYNIMYEGVNEGGQFAGYFGTFSIKEFPAVDADTGDYSAYSDWFFQMVFCGTAASIVSGTIAERMRLWPFLLFTVFLTGLLYPIVGSWEWGTGWLDQMGFSDFAGSTLVHSVGGWAALAGAIVVGARHGKFGPGGVVHPMPGSSIPLATLGTFILWLGWFGFNGASQLAFGTIADAASVAKIFVNTNLAAAAGVLVVVILTQILYRKVDVTMALNGALAGLVSITAEPLQPSVPEALLIGGIGGVIVVVFVPLLDRMRIDDVVGAIPVHLIAGIWGTMIVPLSNADATYYVQFVGVAAVAGVAFFSSLLVWLILAAVTGLRATPEEEAIGLDSAEVGVLAYPEFGGQRA